MEKYQEALDKLKNMGDKDLYNERHLEWVKILQELADILKEYNVTQSNIRKILLAGNQFEHLIDKANKYDEKETPKKPIIKNHGIFYHIFRAKCPSCNESIIWKDNRCLNCGQRLDWSEEVCQQK